MATDNTNRTGFRVVPPSERIRRFQAAYASLSNEERALLPKAIEQSAILSLDAPKNGGTKEVTVGGRERNMTTQEDREDVEAQFGLRRGKVKKK